VKQGSEMGVESAGGELGLWKWKDVMQRYAGASKRSFSCVDLTLPSTARGALMQSTHFWNKETSTPLGLQTIRLISHNFTTMPGFCFTCPHSQSNKRWLSPGGHNTTTTKQKT
jgi:hypothetical protein